jgi:hypothetical protein
MKTGRQSAARWLRIVRWQSESIAAICRCVSGSGSDVWAWYFRVRLERIGNVIRLWDARWCYWSTAGPIATCRALGPRPSLGDAFGVIGRVAHRIVDALPTVLETDLGVSMPIGLVGRTLAPPTRSHTFAFPSRFGHCRISVAKAARCLFESTLFVADRDAIDDRRHARNTARHSDRMFGFVIVLDPTGELDHSIVEGPDVDRALGEDRVIPESFEDMLFQTLVVIFGLELVFLDVLELVFVLGDAVDVAKSLVGNGRTPRAATAKLSGQPTEATDALCDEHPGGEAGHRSDHSADDGSRIRRLFLPKTKP